MLFPNVKVALEIEGLMPERALLRLKRAGISVYNAKKVEKSKILLHVKKKDVEKVFAIYPKVCYNIENYTPYAVREIGGVGIGKLLETATKRIGLLLGAGIFCIATLYVDSYVFDVEFVGSSIYAREAYQILEQGGIKPFAPYSHKKTDWICSQMLALDGVEFCSVKKSGFRVRMEVRLADFSKPSPMRGVMQVQHTGELVALTVLRGTALKKIGDEVRKGETLVGDWFSTEEGEQVRVEIIARARIACVYEANIEAEDAESAFAVGYLELDLSDGDCIKEHTAVKLQEGLFRVRVAYEAVEQMNL